MYLPEYNRVKDPAVALAFMKANPFAILVSAATPPFATHLPVVVAAADSRISVRGHFARANAHWKLLEQEREALVIFHGPHAYISPRLYESRESVPTWNYAAVHAYGHGRIFAEPEDVTAILLETIAAFDPAYLEQWRQFSEEHHAKLLGQIVGFEIAVERLEAKFKLSQNRSRADQASVVASLETSEDSVIAGVAKLMKDQGLGS